MRHSSGFYSAELGLHGLHPTLPFYASRRVCGDRNKSADASDALQKAPLVDLLGHQRRMGVFLWDNHARRHGRSNAEHVREPEDARMIWNSFPKQQSLPERIISNPSSLNGTPLEFSEIKWSVPATCTTRKGMRSSTVWDCCKQAVPDKKLARQRRCDDLQATTPYSEPV